MTLNAPDRFKNYSIRALYIIMPLTALIAVGATFYLWQKAFKPESEPVSISKLPQKSSDEFSAAFELALVPALSEFGIEDKDIDRRNPVFPEDTIKRIYRVNIPENASLSLFNFRITTMVEKIGGTVFRGIEGSGGSLLTLSVGAEKTPTDLIILRKKRGFKPRTAKIAIIVDDLGIKNLDLAKRFCSLGQIVTFSILPYQKNTSEVVDLALNTDIPYILHMPMEPKSGKANPGKGAVFTSDNEKLIHEKLRRAFKDVKGARGLNNHMGSKATEDIRTMEFVTQFLNENNYFFIDSQTSRNSKGYDVSCRNGVKTAKMSGFIDAVNDKANIEKRLDELTDLAFKQGYAIIICHNRLNTIEALEKKLPKMYKKGIKFIKVTDLIH